MYEFLEETVANNMTRRVRRVTPQTTVGDLYRLFAVNGFDAYPVVQGDDLLIGVVSKLDALKVFAFTEAQLLPHYTDGMATTVGQIMSSDVVSVDPETRLQRVLQLMVNHRIKSIPVVDRQRKLLGIIAREDVMRAMERSAARQFPSMLPFGDV
jgi:CBS-domain-containing membrane protein